MLEGLAALAQDVLGFQAGNLYVTKAGLDEIDDVSLADVLPGNGNYVAARDGALRGGAYLFARWLYDRAGGDEALADGSAVDRGGPAFVRTVLEDPRTLGTQLPELTGAELADVVADFFAAVALSNRETVGDAAAVNPCFRYRPLATDPVTARQRGADLFVSFHGQALRGPHVQPADGADGRLRAGGVEILRLGAAPGAATTAFELTVDERAAARLRVARIR